MKIFNTNNNDFIFIGDIHGNFRLLIYKLEQLGISNVNIIVCGDIALGFHKKLYYTNEFKKIQRKLSKLNIHLYFFRGNHDDPEYFENEEIKSEILKFSKNIHILNDYDIIKHPKYNIIIIGGAISIDRCERWKWDKMTQTIVNDGYWPNEIIKPIPNNYINELYENGINKIDIVCSHSAPMFCPPYGKNGLEFYAEHDDKLLEDCDKERNHLESIFNILEYNFPMIKYWFYGHFHKSYSYEYKNVRFYGLDKIREDGKLTPKEIFDYDEEERDY